MIKQRWRKTKMVKLYTCSSGKNLNLEHHTGFGAWKDGVEKGDHGFFVHQYEIFDTPSGHEIRTKRKLQFRRVE